MLQRQRLLKQYGLDDKTNESIGTEPRPFDIANAIYGNGSEANRSGDCQKK
jgi:hypothetical protein